MEGLSKISVFLLVIAGLHHVSSSNTKEGRKVGLLIPEKISTIIDIVHSHKNKPAAGQTTAQQTQSNQQQYQPAPGYQPQYPNYQYPPQNQGAYQSQYQNQYQNQYGYQPQTGSNYNNYPSYTQNNQAPAYQGPALLPSYGSSQGQSQSQYQNMYPQNQGNQYQSQNQQSSGQYQNQNQNQQSTGQYQNQNQNQMTTGQYQNQNQNQNQQSNQFQGSSNQQSNFQGTNQQSNFQGSSNQQSNQYQGSSNQQSNQYQGSANQQSGGQYVSQNQQTTQFTQGSSGNQSGFTVSTGQSGSAGPTCICQTWTKPEKGMLNEVPSPKAEESSENPENV